MADNQQRELQPQILGQYAARAVNATSSQHTSAPYLDHSQQTLLVAALNSQLPNSQTVGDGSARNILSAPAQTSSQAHLIDSQASQLEMDTLDNNFTPDLLDFENDFDFDNADLGGSMIGALPGQDDDYTQHEKRKNEDDEAEEGDAKRQETTEKGSKKPGRKPLTNEPTTKRKAQNRAAQRAFRERKEAHLKDLETKVTELTKSQEADKHENGLLRAQVDRLQTELREYRKRLSLNSTTVKRSPTLTGQAPARNQMGFQFDFPKFGSLPTAQILGNGAGNDITPPLSIHSPVSTSFSSHEQNSRHNSETRSMSPATTNQLVNTRQSSRVPSVDPSMTGNFLQYSTADNMHGFSGTLPQMGKTSADPFGDLFSPSLLKSVSHGQLDGNYFGQNNTNTSTTNNTSSNGANGGDSTAGIPDHRVFRFNSTSVASDTASPSMSSLSHGHTANSSCGTSPEPIGDSPATKLKSMESTESAMKPTQQYSFGSLQPGPNDLNFANMDAFQVPQIESFDPVLFGDYRDTNDNIVGGGDFTGGFFDDNSFNSQPFDLASPSTLFGILSPSTTGQRASNAPTPSHNLLADVEKAREGGDDDYGLPTAQAKSTDPAKNNLISCTKIWTQLQSNPDFQDGKFDLDGLCSELRTKARCSESGLLVDANHVDQALKKLVSKPDGNKPEKVLMFEQESWDNVLKKLKAGN